MRYVLTIAASTEATIVSVLNVLAPTNAKKRIHSGARNVAAAVV